MRIYDQNIWGNYKPCERIANRNQLITELINKYSPDICCFQECNPLTSRAEENDIAKMLEVLGYTEACAELADKNFTPVFYRQETMELVADGYHLFEGLNDRNSKSFTWALLEEKASGKRIVAVSVHFWWKWESEADEAQRKENARVLANYCTQLYEKYNVPVIVAGDLNSGINAHQGDATYHEMLNLGFKDTRDISAESTDSFTAHAYPVLNGEGIYINGGIPIKTLDYIFLSRESTVNAKRFAVLTEQNALDSSDHCPLMFDFEI